MDQDTYIFLVYLAVFVILGIFLYLFYNKSRKQNLPIKNFIINLFFGFLYISGELFYQLNIIQSEFGILVLRNIVLSLSSIQIIWLYIFIEELNRPRPNYFNSLVVVAFFIIQNLGFWLRVIFFNINESNPIFDRTFLLIGRVGYNFLAFFVYFLGVKTYLQLYNYTKEKRGFLLLLSLILMFFGYFMTFFIDIIRFYATDLAHSLQVIKTIGDVLPIIGLLVFILVYFLNVKYIFRIPYNHYILLVSIKNTGSVVFSMQFETKNKEVHLVGDIFSGMLFTINQIYIKIFKSSFSIKEIASEDVSISIKNGEIISALIVTDRISSILERGLSKFVKEFENKFANLLISDSTNLSNFKDGKKILNNIFPFLVEKKKKNLEN